MIPLTRAIPERIRGGYDNALYKSTFTLLTLLSGLDESLFPWSHPLPTATG